MAFKKAPSSTRSGKTPSGRSRPKPAHKPSRPESTLPNEYRLQKFLASAGLGSRRQCEELIRSGRVTIDGMPVENPGINVDPVKQVIEYDGERLKQEKHRYFVLNKPKGVLCTNHDPAGRARVIDFFTKEKVRLFPVGRLDEDSEGLIIVTNDGDLANQLAHPRYRIYRTYRVQVAGHPTDEKLRDLREGMYFREGKFQILHTKRVGKQGKSSFLEVVLGQGHNREVRRLFARVGHKVLSLERVAFGPIKLGKLKTGEYRELTSGELIQLSEILERNRSTPENATKRPPSSESSEKRPERTDRAEKRRPRPTDETAGEQGKPRRAPAKRYTPARPASTPDDGVNPELKKRIRRPASPRTTQQEGKSSGGSASSQRGGKKPGKRPASNSASRGKGKPSTGKKSGPKTYDFN